MPYLGRQGASRLRIISIAVAQTDSIKPISRSFKTMSNSGGSQFCLPYYTPLTFPEPVLIPPQAPPTWSHTPAEVLALTKDAIAATRAVHDRIAAIPAASRSFASVILPIAAAATILETRTECLIFYKNVAPDTAVRDASNEAKGLLDEFKLEALMRVDVFEAVRGAAEEVQRSKVQLDAEEKRLVEKMLLDGKRAGLALPEPERKELRKVLRPCVLYMVHPWKYALTLGLRVQLKKELSQTCLEFSKNFNEENASFPTLAYRFLSLILCTGYHRVHTRRARRRPSG